MLRPPDKALSMTKAKASTCGAEMNSGTPKTPPQNYICMMERMCFGSPGGARAGQQTSVMDVMGIGSSKMGTGAGSKLS